MLVSLNSVGQNLVPDSSIEDTIGCYFSGVWLQQVGKWFNPTTGTPDYYSPYQQCGYSSTNNPNGFQLAHSGECYAGLYTYLTPNTREYVEAMLDSPLEAGKSYCVSFYVSLADTFRYASDNLGAYFSVDSVTSSNYQNLPYIPQVLSTTGVAITNSDTWTLVSGAFLATGGERYITIGNFFNTSNTYYEEVNPLSLNYSAYYYVDDISVIKCEVQGQLAPLESLDVNLFPIPASEEVNITLWNFKGIGNDLRLDLIDEIGRRYLIKYDVQQSANGLKLKLNTQDLSPGSYFVRIQTGRFSLVRKVIIQ